ncbi:MAG TPA: Hsp70 family protein [Solibacterales bacterium]|nr:Hsp70 family protein [Bryobacterales bacterium]
MRLGVDFGTTRIVVAVADRGNYPVVTFEAPDGTTWDWFPPLAAAHEGRRLFGWEAWAVQGESQATVLRSLKRSLQEAGPCSVLDVGGVEAPLLEWLVALAAALRRDLLEKSSLRPREGEPLEVMLGVPANANSNQRFLTSESFRLAGFDVLGLLNEPSAASIEFGHKQREAGAAGEQLLVYDLGGGTFDASLVQVSERTHSVVASEGASTLGGDDFDEALAELALDPGRYDTLSQAEHFRLLEECREKKEAIHPNTRRIVVDLERVRDGWGQVTVPVADYYERCRPLVDETVRVVGDLLARAGGVLDALYVTGGGSELPLVARVLRDEYGRRVKRSAHTRSATAIGLAIQADTQSGYLLREQFTRNFGVWRETDAGRAVVFDPLFAKGTPLPAAGEPPLERARTYSPVHNVGHFRYLECSQRSDDGQPVGDITSWDEVRFPFDPSLEREARLELVGVERTAAAAGQEIEERYRCDSSGTVTVTIANRTAGYSRSYRLGRWAGEDTRVAPARKKRIRKN